MFGDKKRRIQTLEQQLRVGEQQYNAALVSIGELRALLDRAGGGDIVKMQEVAAQMRGEQVELQAALERQKLDLSCTGWGGLCFRVGFFVGILGVGWSFRGTKAEVGSGG